MDCLSYRQGLDENCQQDLGRCLVNFQSCWTISHIFPQLKSLSFFKISPTSKTKPQTNAFYITRFIVKNFRCFLSWMLFLSAKTRQGSDHILIRKASNWKPHFWFSWQVCNLEQSMNNTKGNFSLWAWQVLPNDLFSSGWILLWKENSVNNHVAYCYLANAFSLVSIFLHSCEKLMEKLHTHSPNMNDNLLHTK